MNIVVAIVIVIIICVQSYFFIKNLKRMHEFRDIFSNNQTDYSITKDENGFVTGIYGVGINAKSSIFGNIINSINKYLQNNKGSVIDFHLLKDAVDRHCDAIEEDINTQTPIPLYCGLAGTMIGVILGLGSLLWTGAIKALIAGTGTTTGEAAQVAADSAAGGINHLLFGIAWAMGASIVGIILTTCNSYNFKGCKLQEENGKNTFLAWMQANLLPELPSDTAGVMKGLIRNLNKFNNTFSENVEVLSGTFNKVNESYKTQADIIQMVHDMDVAKMARANVNVLKHLQECTDKLEQFNSYLDKVNEFNLQFSQEAKTQEIFQNISTFFNRHKVVISKEIADADNCLGEAMSALNSNAEKSVVELQSKLTEQSEHFKSILEEEKTAFMQFSKDIQIQFKDQMEQLPTMAQKLEEISQIPVKLDHLFEKIEESQKSVCENINSSNAQLIQSLVSSNKELVEHLIMYHKNGDLKPSELKIPKKILISFYILVFFIFIIGIISIIRFLNFF